MAHGFVNLKSLQRPFLCHIVVHADDYLFLAVHGELVAVRGFRNLALRVRALDRRHHPAECVNLLDVIPRAALDLVGQRFDEIGSAQRIHRVGHSAFVGEDLLRAEGDGRGELRGERPGLIEGIGVQRLRAPKHRGQRLKRCPHHVVIGLLRRERASRGLGVKAERPGAGRLGAKALAHGFVPNPARRAILGNFLEEIAVGVEEEGKPRAKLIHIQPAAHAPFHVLDAVAQCEGQFLDRCRTGFADVISADGDGVELRRVLGAELEGINHQPHGRFGRIDVFLLRDVFLEDIVLNRARNFLPVGRLLFRDG